MFPEEDRNEADDSPSNDQTPESSGGEEAPAPAPERPSPDPDVPDIIEPENPLSDFSFDQLPDLVRANVEKQGWQTPTPVQAKAAPYVREGRDMIVQARTGSGKTGAFVLPLIERIDPDLAACQALIMTPTRELANQVLEQTRLLGEGTGVRAVAIYGGVGYGPQLDALREGAHIVVGTPGRLLDHLARGTLDLTDLNTLILDEADHMLSMGFYPDMRRVRQYLPAERSSFLFSATIPFSVRRLAQEFLGATEYLTLSHRQVHVADSDHIYYVCNAMDRDRVVGRILEIENPESALIFCNRKTEVHFLTVVLQRFGYDAEELSADLNQNQRERILKRFRARRLRFVVATDVAARGIDITDLSHVIIYGLPQDRETYIHRAGRTGRAGKGGVVMSLVTPVEEIEFKRVARHYDIDLERREPPEEEEVEKVVADREIARLEQRARELDNITRERMRRYTDLAASLAESEEGRLLLAMLLDADYEAARHRAADDGDSDDDRPTETAEERGRRAREREEESGAEQKGRRRSGRRRSGRRR